MEMININKVKPASYNPRKISDTQFKKLQTSIKEHGFVMPILVNKQNNTIIAGHQRTKAAKAIGIHEVPVFYIDGINQADEVKFNQIHNGTDNEFNAIVKLKEDLLPGFYELGAEEFFIKDKNAMIVKEICKLILKYGNVLCCVIDKEGSLVGGNYVHACKMLGIKVNTSVIETKEQRSLLKEDYGVFSYGNLKKNTWVQGLAQMFRDATEKETGKRKNRSSLYTNMVLPFILGKDSSVLDFGCGKGAYIRQINKPNALGVEFYNNNGKSIDIGKGKRQIDSMVKHIEENGQFDVVVCDSVLNSVDSVEAENAVLGCLNALCVLGGTMFISGRTVEGAKVETSQKVDGDNRVTYIRFLDENKFSGDFRKGKWYYQHFHDKQDINTLIERFGFQIEELFYNKFSKTWQVRATKIQDISIEQKREAIDFEFNLPLPQGKSYKRHHKVKKVLGVD